MLLKFGLVLKFNRLLRKLQKKILGKGTFLPHPVVIWKNAVTATETLSDWGIGLVVVGSQIQFTATACSKWYIRVFTVLDLRLDITAGSTQPLLRQVWPWQVIHTHLPLSPNSIIWYQPVYGLAAGVWLGAEELGHMAWRALPSVVAEFKKTFSTTHSLTNCLICQSDFINLHLNFTFRCSSVFTFYFSLCYEFTLFTSSSCVVRPTVKLARGLTNTFFIHHVCFSVLLCNWQNSSKAGFRLVSVSWKPKSKIGFINVCRWHKFTIRSTQQKSEQMSTV